MWSRWQAPLSDAPTVLSGYGSSLWLPLSAVEFLRCVHAERQRFALAQRKLVPVCPLCRAHRHGLQRSPGLLASAGSRRLALPHQSGHQCFRPPLQLWAPVLPRRLRCRSVHHTDAPLNQLVGPLHENCGPLLGAVSGLASKCCPECMRLSGSSTSAPTAVRGPGPGSAGPMASYLPRAQVPPISSHRRKLRHWPRACHLQRCRAPRASGGSADATSRTCGNKCKSLGAEDGLPNSTGGNVAATRVLLIAKASTQPASSPLVPPADGGQRG